MKYLKPLQNFKIPISSSNKPCDNDVSEANKTTPEATVCYIHPFTHAERREATIWLKNHKRRGKRGH